MGDPRTRWVSPDGVVAVVPETDLPDGIMRAPNRFSVKEAAVAVNANRANPFFLRHVAPGDPRAFAAVRRADLPWEAEARVWSFVMPAGPPSQRVIPDWPKTCPRCQKPSAAVELFTGWDCRHGCFARKAVVR